MKKISEKFNAMTMPASIWPVRVERITFLTFIYPALAVSVRLTGNSRFPLISGHVRLKRFNVGQNKAIARTCSNCAGVPRFLAVAIGMP